jgi:DNA-binding LacI/PurR family transcriptional regulator
MLEGVVTMQKPKKKILSYNRIADALRDRIDAGMKPGERLPSELALSKKFGVSIVTIRNALLRLQLDGVLERRHGSGTYVAEHKNTRKHVALRIGTDIFRPRLSYYYTGVIRELRRLFTRHGYGTTVYVAHSELVEQGAADDCPEFTEALENGRICAVAGMALHLNDYDAEIIKERKIPIVGETDEFPYSVRSDFYDNGRYGVRSLVENGRRKLAIITWPYQSRKKVNPDSIVEGFLEELKQRRIPIHKEWVRDQFDASAEAPGWEQFSRLWSARSDKPDGLVIGDDMLFADAAAAIMELGIKVPEQLMVITHSNKGSLARVPFPVAQIQYDPLVQANGMGEILLKLLDGKPVSQNRIVLRHQLIPMPS